MRSNCAFTAALSRSRSLLVGFFFSERFASASKYPRQVEALVAGGLVLDLEGLRPDRAVEQLVDSLHDMRDVGRVAAVSDVVRERTNRSAARREFDCHGVG